MAKITKNPPSSRAPKSGEIVGEALTFDDVLLLPARSAVMPRAVNLETPLGGCALNAPVVSAAMDTVTESAMAIAMAQSGGLGAIHRNMDAEKQAGEVERVKRFESGVVSDPMCVRDNMNVGDVLRIKKESGFSGLPVVNADGEVVGIVTNRDLRFEERMSAPVTEVMTPLARLVTVKPGFRLAEAKRLMKDHRIERVMVIDRRGRLRGLVTVKDIIKTETFPNACKDKDGRLRVAAAVGVFSADSARMDKLAEAGADVFVVDSAHGHSEGVLETVAKLKKRHGGAQVLAGNIATEEGARALAQAGADAVKVGIGPGSICTTRVVAGVGVPQVSAILNAARGLRAVKNPPTLVADGGMRYSGDVAKALAAGAHAVMLGGVLAGTDESPGAIELFQGRAYKHYRGMGSLGALQQSGNGGRYAASDDAKPVPEGVEGRVAYKGRLQDVVEQILGGVRAAMGYVGAANLESLRRGARFVRITAAGMRESHVHDVQIVREAPNYQAD